VPQHPLGTEGVCGHLQEMKCCSLILFCHCRTCQTRHLFSHICVNGFGACIGALCFLEVPPHPHGTEEVCGHLQCMKCYNRTMFCHCRTCRTRHLSSYMRQWFWDLYWSISPRGGASMPPRYRWDAWAPARDEMLQQDLVLPLPHLPN
jgi:hypothetical protein